MSGLLTFKTGELPDYIKWQVLSFIRVQWPEGFKGENRLRDWITREDEHPVSFVKVENDLVISYAEVVRKDLIHCNITYRTYGLTGVFTFPSFRNEGHGLSVVKAARTYIDMQTDADVVYFCTTTKRFYEMAGFERMEDVKILYGDPKNPKESDETAYMLFLSDKGKLGRKDFESTPVYFGLSTW